MHEIWPFSCCALHAADLGELPVRSRQLWLILACGTDSTLGLQYRHPGGSRLRAHGVSGAAKPPAICCPGAARPVCAGTVIRTVRASTVIRTVRADAVAADAVAADAVAAGLASPLMGVTGSVPCRTPAP